MSSEPIKQHACLRHRWRIAPALALAVVLTGASPSPAFARAGDLDRTFSGDGKLVHHRLYVRQPVMVLQEDERIIVAGTNHEAGGRDIIVARFNRDGSPDRAFGTDGRVVTDLGGNEEVAAVALMRGGRVLVVGSTASDETAPGNFLLFRYNNDGSPDRGFGQGGRVVTDFGGYDNAEAVALTGDGQIVVAGRTEPGRSRRLLFALGRYRFDGSLDPSFDGDGKTTTDFGVRADTRAVAVQRDGKIVAAGRASTPEPEVGAIALARYHRNGRLDASFDGDGKVTQRIGNEAASANAIRLLSNGSILIGGAGGGRPKDDLLGFLVARFTARGRLDTSFGRNGATITMIHGTDRIEDLALQRDGKIVATGPAGDVNTDVFSFAVMRYTARGIPDPTFGTNGLVKTKFVPEGEWSQDLSSGVAVLRNGKILVVGDATSDEADGLAFARYLGR